MKEQSLKFEDLKEGMRVEDWWGNVGIVAVCNDTHNVLIKFDNGGSSLYCLAEDCEDRDPTPIYSILEDLKLVKEEIKRYNHKCIKCHLIFRNDVIVYKTRRDIICPNCQEKKMKSLTLKEAIEKIQRPKKEYNEYFQNTLTFWPESWKLFIQKIYQKK